jgi:hypothetical protein
MTAKKKTEQAGENVDELVTPEEHTEAMEGIEPTEDVSDPGVPADVEVASRSADMDTPSTTHEKTFVAGPNPVDNSKNPYTEANGYDHEPNKLVTRQYAIDAGLWPTADVAFKSAKKHPDGESWILTYTVEVIPANDAPEGSQTPSVSAVALPEYDDEGEATGETKVVDALNYLPPEAVAAHGADGDETA